MTQASAIINEETPRMVRYIKPLQTGIQLISFSHYVLGYVVQGTMYLHDGDQRTAIKRGSIFCFGIGCNYVENVPYDEVPLELIVFYYTSDDIQRILLHLNLSYGLTMSHERTYAPESRHPLIVMTAWNALQDFFRNICQAMQEPDFPHDRTMAQLKMAEFIHLVLTHSEHSLASLLLNQSDTTRKKFEQEIYTHLFHDISIEDLARRTGRSLTAFKQEFHRCFQMSPHRWYLLQRLKHARLLLLSTSKSISEISNECSIPNTSHFIKLFKNEYHATPANYRALQRQNHSGIPTAK